MRETPVEWTEQLGQGQLPMVMHHYAHMLYHDGVIWTRFLQLGDERVGRCWYDVKVGVAAEATQGKTDRESRILRGTHAKRIDVCFDWGGTLHVCEIKPFGNHAALGQSLLYRSLFVRQYPAIQPVVGMICCGQADGDIIAEARSQRILVVEVGMSDLV